MDIQKKKSLRAKYENEDDEDSEVSFSIAYEKLVDDLSEAPTVAKTRENENALKTAVDSLRSTIQNFYRVCDDYRLNR